MTKFVLLWLEGPLQSWGTSSQFDVRSTEDFPSWSGLCGLICCALGRKGAQKDFLAELTRYEPVITVFNKVINGRKIPRTLMRDFHTVGARYSQDDPFEMLMIPKKIDGKKPSGTDGVIVTTRYAVQDGVYAAVMEFESELAAEICHALTHPYWPLYLGRKAYLPTDLVFKGVFDSRALAERELKRIAADKGLLWDYQVLPGALYEQGDVLECSDVPVSFGLSKELCTRLATKVSVSSDGDGLT